MFNLLNNIFVIIIIKINSKNLSKINLISMSNYNLIPNINKDIN